MTTAFPFIKISGAPYERGVQYGRQASSRIDLGLDLYRTDFERRGIAWAHALTLAGRYRTVVETYSEEMWQEILGIAEGSGQSVDAILLLNVRTELSFEELGPSGGDIDGCTALLALPETTEDGHVLHGQSWDWRPGCVDTSVVLHITPEQGPAMLLFCEAGQLARHGMNSAGVAITANGLQCDHDGGDVGLPSPFMRRKMFMKESYSEAIGILLNSKRSFSHNIIISHKDGEAIGIEATPHAAYWLEPKAGILTHANHFKHPVALQAVQDLSLMRHPESLHRDSRVHRALNHAYGNITVDTFKEALADRFDSPNAVCRSPAYREDGAHSCTVANLIMDSAMGKMWVAPAPYEGADYTEYAL